MFGTKTSINETNLEINLEYLNVLQPTYSLVSRERGISPRGPANDIVLSRRGASMPYEASRSSGGVLSCSFGC